MTVISNLMVKIGVDSSGLSRGLANADNQIQRSKSTFNGLGLGVAAVGGALIGLGVAAVNAAVEWETAFTGVEKTVEGSAEQLAALETQLRDMATDTSNPLSSLDNAAITLATIAELGGSLGIATDDLDEFVQTVGMLAMTTDMTAENAGTMIAQFANITGMDVDDYDNFGSTLVDLGNKMAATEGQIMEFAQRIAAAGERAGFSEQEILAFSASMASVGLNPEAGGSAFSQVMNEIVKAVELGGPKLETFADAAGMTAEAFQEGWANDPAGTFVAFLEGLSEMDGAEQLQTLSELGLSGIRVTDTVTRLAGGVDLVADSLDVSNGAWEQNTALMTEAEKRADTAAGKMNALQNNLNELGIVVGNALLPPLNDAVVSLTDLVSNLSEGDLGEGLGDNFLDMAEDIADAMTPLEDDITLPNFAEVEDGWTKFGQSIGTILAHMAIDHVQYTANVTEGLARFIRDMEELLARANIAAADVALFFNPNDQDAINRKALFTLDVRAIEAAESIESQINAGLAAGDITIDLGQYVDIDPAILAQKIVDPGLIQSAIFQALAEKDQAALDVLLPIAAALGIDVDALILQFQESVDAAAGAQNYQATVTIDLLALPGRIDMSPVNVAIGNMAAGSGGMAADVADVRGSIPGLASGGYIASEGLAYLHAGEQVLTAAQTQDYNGRGNGGTVNINTNMSVDALIADLERRGYYIPKGYAGQAA